MNTVSLWGSILPEVRKRIKERNAAQVSLKRSFNGEETPES